VSFFFGSNLLLTRTPLLSFELGYSAKASVALK
jgi:hypothetical protein